jgi:hypothetical protein
MPAGAMRAWPWAVVLVVVVGSIVALAFGRRGDPGWDRSDHRPLAAVAESEPGPPAPAPAAVTLSAGLPPIGRLEIDVTTIRGEQTGQRRVRSGWELGADGEVVLREPSEEDAVSPGEARARARADGSVVVSGGDLPSEARAAFADGVRALLALGGALAPGERAVGQRLVVGAERSLVTAAAPDRFALAAEASSLPGAEADETLVRLVDGVPRRVERHWTRRDGSLTVVTRVVLERRDGG